MRRGLTMDMIVAEATKLVEEKGYGNFSVRELAQCLHVKAASLYNHINSIDDVNRAIGTHAAAQLNGVLERATEGKRRDEALYALVDEYRLFVRENYELYRAVIGLPLLDEDGAASDVGRASIRVIRNVVCQYEIAEEDSVHFSRGFRSALHGFILLEKAGYFTGRQVMADKSFAFMVRGTSSG
ncbi:MAG: TetR/AcrR family transcriptional regulator [Lachnospiraceae bacterium]|nr:TetR/AcrR family transcriptional regulator [Lachnospiraceae bacterium]